MEWTLRETSPVFIVPKARRGSMPDRPIDARVVGAAEVTPVRVDDPDAYRWLHERYSAMLMHEDELIHQRTSLMLTASSIFIGAYFLAVEYDPTHTVAIEISVPLALFGIILAFAWLAVVRRTVAALELWRSQIIGIEKSRFDSSSPVDRLYAIYTLHEATFQEHAGYVVRGRTGADGQARTFASTLKAVLHPNLTVKEWFRIGVAPLDVQATIPYIFLIAWVAILIVALGQNAASFGFL